MSVTSYFIGKALLVTILMIIQTALLLLFGTLMFGLNLPTSPTLWWNFTWLVILGSACSTVLGIAFSVVPKSGRGASAVVSPIVIILQFFSGVFFVFTSLPTWMQQFAALFPLKWLTQGMRSVFLPEDFATQEVAGTWEIEKTAVIIAIWLVAGLIISIKTFKWSRE
jgi:ABC-2 type transport system permease protein